MKILFGVDKLLYGSGIAMVVEGMARYLHERSYDVKIICGKYDVETKVPITLCKYNERLHHSDVFDILRIIKQEKPDIFHSHYFPMGFCGALINSSRIKHVMHVHGVNHQNWRLNWKIPFALIRADIDEFFGAYFSKKVICLSNYMADVLIKKWRIKRDKIEVVYNSVDTSRFNPSIKGDEIRERYNISNDEVVLLCVAALTPRKRQDLLVDCMKILSKEKQNIRLLLVGESGRTLRSYKKSLIRKVKNAGLDKYIIFCGFVSNEELPKYYAASDIFVSASSWEGFGLPFVEANACGKPVIGFDRAAISELIINGYNGYKVRYPNINDFAASIIRLAKDIDKRKMMGINGRKIVDEKFNFEVNMKRILKIYLQLLS